ncbi:hypothetical protein L0Y59_02235 [Candidatus Uhrbacteria bacterium]|nr:hypothetical protein [Candidatus Uhrbacteria bacterium]
MSTIVRALVAFVVGAHLAYADESDQYLVWDRELADAAPAINGFINRVARERVHMENAKPGPRCDCETLVLDILPEIYLDRLRANLIVFVETSPEIDVYPPRDVPQDDLLRLSIYRRAPVPIVIRVTRTIRIGEVYLGVDKLNHLIGIGRRYYVRYLSHRQSGLSEQGAVDSVIRWGVLVEDSVLGTLINGIFSGADLEANYQGLLFARSFCEGPDPYLQSDGQQWQLAREVDIRDFVAPAFDETYYPPLYADDLRLAVLTVLAEDYAGRADSPAVIARFERYRLTPPSPCMRFIERYLAQNLVTHQRTALLGALRIQPGDPFAPLDPFNLDGEVRAP